MPQTRRVVLANRTRSARTAADGRRDGGVVELVSRGQLEALGTSAPGPRLDFIVPTETDARPDRLAVGERGSPEEWKGQWPGPATARPRATVDVARLPALGPLQPIRHPPGRGDYGNFVLVPIILSPEPVPGLLRALTGLRRGGRVNTFSST